MRLRAVFLVVFGGLFGLSACGGGADTASLVSPPPPPPPPPPAGAPTIDLQPVFDNLNFSQPVAMVQAPNDSSRWFVVEKGGIVQTFTNDPNVMSLSTELIDISGLVDDSFSESGLLGIAFHPDFPVTPEVYLSYTATGPGGGNPLISTVSRFTSLNGGSTLEPATEEIVLMVLQDNTNHNGGDLAFGPDGFLYAAFGDGGGGGDPNDNAQNTANLLGSIVRIDVDGNSPYEIPPTNPFASPGLCLQGFGGANCPEIFAWGLRNPWRMSFDSATGTLWAGDVGQVSWEEVDRIELGQNYGWDDREGAHCHEPVSGCLTNSVDPVTEYDRTLGQSITGGYVYRGTTVTDLIGWYVFADFVSGRVFAIPADTPTFVAPSILLEPGMNFSAFAQDVDGELYIVNYGGTIFQIVDAP